MNTDEFAKKYIQCALDLHQHNQDVVDMYNGKIKPKNRPLQEIEGEIQECLNDLEKKPLQDVVRIKLLKANLISLLTLTKKTIGESFSIKEELGLLFGLPFLEISKKELLTESDSIASQLNSDKNAYETISNIEKKMVIPKESLLKISHRIVDDSKEMTKSFVQIPQNASLEIEAHNDRQDTAFHRYQGGYKGVIELSTGRQFDLNTFTHVLFHEGYPGHHLQCCLDELNFDWLEKDLIYFYGHDAVKAEGLAEMAAFICFEKTNRESYEIDLAKDIGLSQELAGLHAKIGDRLRVLRNKLSTFIVFRNKIPEEAKMKLLQEIGLFSHEKAKKRLKTLKNLGSFALTYDLGRRYIFDKYLLGCKTFKEKQNAYREILLNPYIEFES